MLRRATRARCLLKAMPHATLLHMLRLEETVAVVFSHGCALARHAPAGYQRTCARPNSNQAVPDGEASAATMQGARAAALAQCASLVHRQCGGELPHRTAC